MIMLLMTLGNPQPPEFLYFAMPFVSSYGMNMVDHSKSQFKDNKASPKGAWSHHVTPF